ncbi:TolC family outer membrane protein [Pelagimonas varians]|uniref:TolC family outer membrane protein n=1 Tax=Pelagimonas varians TaxID=696760 RepID=UPI000BEF10D4|nr:TolC family outer membrane protein [Pelagimonas varians]
MAFGFRRFLVASSAAVVLSASSAAPAWADTLADALIGAYTTSGLMDQNRALLRAADEDVAQAVSALRPVISWAGEVTRDFGSSRAYSASFGQYVTSGYGTNTTGLNLIGELTLYDGGSNRLRIEAAKETVLATRSTLLSIEQQVLLRGVSAFMEVRRAMENVELSLNNIRVLKQEVRAARDRFEVGEVTRTDVALAEARLAAAVSTQAAAQGQLVSAKEEYTAAVGKRPGNLIAPTTLPRLPGSVDTGKAIAVRGHPDLVAVQHLVSANEIAIKIADASMRPTVSLVGRIGATENFENEAFTRGGSLGLNAGGPIYSGGKLRSLVRQARANRDATRGQLHTVRNSVQQNVGVAFVQLDVARASKESFRSQVRAATVAFNGVREEAKLGARTTLDVLDAEQELLDARANLISAQVDETIAAYAILSSVGQLTASSLQLNVPQYDPSQYYNLVKGAPSAVSQQGRDLDRVLRALGKE